MEAIDVKAIVDYLLTCPFIGDFTSVLLTDLTGDEVGQSGVFDDGEQRAVITDMLGNQLLPHKYAMVTRISTSKDLDRILAVNFTQKFLVWIRQQELANNYPILPSGYQAYSISASDGRLTARAQDGKTTLYEIPILITYWRFV